MSPDDASFAEMPRPPTDPDADPLALDEETVERLLAGDLPPSQVPPGYAQVAALLAATTAEPTPEELAGQAEVLAELRAVTRPRRAAAHTRRAARPPRRRWAGLAAAALVGALVTGGVAAAATGNLPGPVQNVARNILGDGGGGPVAPTEPGQQPAAAGPSHTSTATPTGPTDGSQGGQPAGTGGPGPDPTAAGNPADPDTVRLCQAFRAGEGAEQGKKLDATAFQALAKLAGGAEKIPSYCQEVLAGGATPGEGKPQEPPGGSGQGQGQGQGGPPTSTGAGDQGQNDQRTTRS
jgi:hypothetical protein